MSEPIYCTGGCDACRDYARELGVPLVVPAALAAQVPAQEERHRASLTLSPKFGPALWLDRRFVARLVASVEDSRVTPEEPEPRWYRDALVFVDAVNSAHGQRPPLNIPRLSRLWDLDEADLRRALGVESDD